MTRTETLFVAVVAILAGLLMARLVIGGDADDGLHCEEDEVAVHGGIEGWYDPDAALECVNAEEFSKLLAYDHGQWEARNGTYDEGFDTGYGYGLENDLADRIYEFAYDNGYGDALSDMANSDAEPTPVATPTPTATPEPEPPEEIAEPAVQVGHERIAYAGMVHGAFPDAPIMGDVVVWRETLNRDDWQDYVYGGAWSATGDCGLMQINWASHADKFAARGWTQADCFDPAKNLVIAREVFDGSGCGAWTTCW